jgi:hypothetical protein
MKKKRKTELIFILDRSSSMGGLEKAVIDGFNTLTRAHAMMPGETSVSVSLFDAKCETLWNGIDAARAVLTPDEYRLGWGTAMLDAIGKTILSVERRLAETVEAERPGKVICCVVTDGKEWMSKEFTEAAVARMIRRKKADGWEFVFLGANIDPWETSAAIGLEKNESFLYESNANGIGSMYDELNRYLERKRREEDD